MGEVGVDKKTAIDWAWNFSLCQICHRWHDDNAVPLGGPGVEVCRSGSFLLPFALSIVPCIPMQVEIDESYFFKRKYNHGRVTEGRWIVGGVARPPGQGYFLVPVADRTRATLHRIIQQWVMPGMLP